jgi:hypothetical protein
MNALSIFLAEFVQASIVPLIVFGGLLLSHPRLLLVGRKSFTELSGFAEDRQTRLLDEASKEALTGWHRVLPVIVCWLLCTVGSALGSTLPKVAAVLPFWVKVCSSLTLILVFVGFGFWLARRLQVHWLRPFLKALIERNQHAA